MLIGNLDYLELVPYLPLKLQHAIEYVKTNINLHTPTGRYLIDDEHIFVIVAENQTEPAQQRLSEYHERYIDIQILLSGEETFIVSTELTGNITQPYQANKDIAFLTIPDQAALKITLKSREFIVFYPPQRHKPLCCGEQPLPVKKAIIKIDKNCL